MPRISGVVPANPWISRTPRVPPRRRNGCSCAGSAGLLQTDFASTAIKFAVYRPASSRRRVRLYGPGENSPVGAKPLTVSWGCTGHMAIVGWLVALALGIVLALFSVGNQQAAVINVLGATYQD